MTAIFSVDQPKADQTSSPAEKCCAVIAAPFWRAHSSLEHNRPLACRSLLFNPPNNSCPTPLSLYLSDFGGLFERSFLKSARICAATSEIKIHTRCMS